MVRDTEAPEAAADRPVSRRLFGRMALAAAMLALSACEAPTFDRDTSTFTFRRRGNR